MFTEMARRLDAAQDINGSNGSSVGSSSANSTVNNGSTEANHGYPPSDTQ
jgi:hypothetical protein